MKIGAVILRLIIKKCIQILFCDCRSYDNLERLHVAYDDFTQCVPKKNEMVSRAVMLALKAKVENE